MLLDKFDALLNLLLRRLRPLAAVLRPLTLYRLLVLAAAVALVRALLLAAPLFEAADVAVERVRQLDSTQYHPGLLGLAGEAEFNRTEDVDRDEQQQAHWAQAVQAHDAYVQTRRNSYLGMAAIGGWAVLLVVLVSVYISESATAVLLPTCLLLAGAGVGLAYLPEIQQWLGGFFHGLSRVLTEPSYVPGKWVLVLVLTGGAAGRDLRRRRRAGRLPLGPAEAGLVPVSVHAYSQAH